MVKITNYYAELSQNLKIFKGYQELKEGKNYSKLTSTQKKIINDELNGFKLGGVGLSKKSVMYLNQYNLDYQN
jgi:oligopeptidase A